MYLNKRYLEINCPISKELSERMEFLSNVELVSDNNENDYEIIVLKKFSVDKYEIDLCCNYDSYAAWFSINFTDSKLISSEHILCSIDIDNLIDSEKISIRSELSTNVTIKTILYLDNETDDSEYVEALDDVVKVFKSKLNENNEEELDLFHNNEGVFHYETQDNENNKYSFTYLTNLNCTILYKNNDFSNGIIADDVVCVLLKDIQEQKERIKELEKQVNN